LVIAYISYEHPASFAGGGIGTYIGQISKLMASRGHRVEVFSGTLSTTPSTWKIDGYFLNLIPAVTKEEFRSNLLPVFKERHELVPFEIIESPEYGADALNVKKAFPKIPLTLKLHTPSFLTGELNDYKRSWKDKLRFMLGGLLRGKISKPYWIYNKNEDPEYELYNLAETSSSPSKSLAEIAGKKWNNDKIISVLPYPFEISDQLLKIQPITNFDSRFIITFIGKLEKRKGILDLMKAIPPILNTFPDTIFRFIGKASPSPDPNLDMISYIKNKLKAYENSLEFMGYQEYNRIPSILEESHICIFPSLWENFPNVCLEAMAAGRVAIGTDNGGMADMINHNINGILIPPNSPKAIYNVVKELITNPHRIISFGNAARTTILENYNGDTIADLTENLYRKTISIYE
jgi:glycogen synthase